MDLKITPARLLALSDAGKIGYLERHTKYNWLGCCNRFHTAATVRWLEQRGFLEVFPGGVAYVTDAGRSVLAEQKKDFGG